MRNKKITAILASCALFNASRTTQSSKKLYHTRKPLSTANPRCQTMATRQREFLDCHSLLDGKFYVVLKIAQSLELQAEKSQ